MMITREGSLLSIGRDFVDCVAGDRWASKGVVTINGVEYRWRAVVGCGDAEHVIRAAADGQRITFFSSQAL
jgi:hypothetical protein